jgi:hypothetical protein
MANSIIQMSGGLGNQLFQFAIKRSVEYATGSTTKLDIAWYKYKSVEFNRQPEIIRFLGNNEDYTDSSNHLLNFFGLLKSRRIRFYYKKLVERKLLISNQRMNLKIKLEKDIKQISDFVDSYSVGSFIGLPFWVAYSESIVNEIRNSLTQVNVGEQVVGPRSIVIHARRGDYYLDAKTRNFHGYCSLDHFIEGVAIISELHEWETVVIYSDSPEFEYELQSALISRYSKPVYIAVENDPLKILLNFQKANLFIGSNSTLSWWGNALGAHKSSVFPNSWFANNKEHEYGKDYFFNDVTFTDKPLLVKND